MEKENKLTEEVDMASEVKTETGSSKISQAEIEAFLEGSSDEKYLTSLLYEEYDELIYKIYKDPVKGKVVKKVKPTHFFWTTDLPASFYNSDKKAIKNAMKSHGIQVIKLQTNGLKRLEEGYKYIFLSTKSFKNLKMFFFNGGLNPYKEKEIFMTIPAEEQYLIQNGIRLFKGMDSYSDIHTAVFDIETTSLEPEDGRVFLIGIKDNKGYEEVLYATNEDDSERQLIYDFFTKILSLKSANITGYNSENFDWYYLFKRAEILGMDIHEHIKQISPLIKLKRLEKFLKIGNEVEKYDQTYLWGYNVVDTIHSVRRAMAQNSDIKSASLKYIAKQSQVVKHNRVYVEHLSIAKIYEDPEDYYFNEFTGSYLKVKPNFEFIDVLTEKEVQDNPNKIYIFEDDFNKSFNQFKNTIGVKTKYSSGINEKDFLSDKDYTDNILDFLETNKEIVSELKSGKTIVLSRDMFKGSVSNLKEIAPKTYQYYKDFIANLFKYEVVSGQYIIKRYLMDDLDETIKVNDIYSQSSFLLAKILPSDYARISTMGTASMWKLLMLCWSYEKKLAVPKKETPREFVGGLSKMFNVGFMTDVAKFDYSSLYPSIQITHGIFPDEDITGVLEAFLRYFHSQRNKYKSLMKKAAKEGDYKAETFYDRKQLPIKILNNSLYGALTAPNVFNWSNMLKGEQITCSGRQYLRLIIKHLLPKGFIPVVCDTDGINLKLPEGYENYTYIGRGLCEKVENGKIYKGIDAYLAEFNDTYMRGVMGLSLDGIVKSTINISRKNYANLEITSSGKEKIKLVGATIKSKKLQTYIEDFLDEGINLLLLGDGYGFVQKYYDYIDKLYNKQVPIIKIANKARVKMTVEAYREHITKTNAKGGKLPQQAHMNLALEHNLHLNLGDVVYYVNNGSKKSHGDIGNSYLLDAADIEKNPNKLGDYNVARAISTLNSRITPLLTVFKPEVRDDILISDPKDKKLFIRSQLDLVFGIPMPDVKQDVVEEVLVPEERELIFWEKYNEQNGLNYDPDIFLDEDFEFNLPGLKL